MSDATIAPGCVIHWDGFTLSDGEDGHKYFVIVGAQPGKNYLAVIATSRKKGNRQYKFGGNHEYGWYHIPGDKKNFFWKETWLLFQEPQEFSAPELLKLKFLGEISIKGSVQPEIANAICNCMMKCDDVSEYHRSLLGPKHQPKKS